MERHRKCKRVVRIIDYKHYCKKIVCQTSIEVSPIDISEVSIIPTVNRYFYIPVSTIDLTNGATIPSNLFYNDDGGLTTEFMIFCPNGHVNLYINGVMQQGGMYRVNTNSLIINPTASKISASTPIVIESLGFSSK
ncbi:DUF4183 domain-containing protein [Sporosarcina sp. E16_3]|uniref:DUF4183 domain-containing protein n=1 Tax=Sporosarcina sp. E16_3 TaxID=2789293 RepID=UPI001A91C449|nr:DUF4183 domain-containing protein [Sporosarcina sp. E16_3]MBO0602624.1 DUF4183 domain-containing protein [Sporosarcina sp. E16_3]